MKDDIRDDAEDDDDDDDSFRPDGHIDAWTSRDANFAVDNTNRSARKTKGDKSVQVDKTREKWRVSVLRGNVPRRALDELLLKIGLWGFFPLGVLLLLYYANALAKMYMPLATFVAWMPHHCCKVNGSLREAIDATSSPSLLSWTSKPRPHSTDSLSGGHDSATCKKLVRQYGWNYATQKSNSLSADEDLGCRNVHYVAQIANAVFMGGFGVGGLFHGVLADAYGRKPVLVTSTWSLGIYGFVTGTVPDETAFIGVRFLHGFFVGGISLASSTMICELFPSKQRAIPHMLIQICNVVGFSLLDLTAYFERRWRLLLFILPLYFIGTLCFLFALAESLEWLFLTGQAKRACEYLQSVIDSRGMEADVYEELYINASRMVGQSGSEIDFKPPVEETNVNAGNDDDDDDDDDDEGIVVDGDKNNNNDDDGEDDDDDDDDDDDENRNRNEQPYPSNETNESFLKPNGRRPSASEWSLEAMIVVGVLSTLTLINFFVYYGLVLSTDEFAGERYLNFFLFTLADLAGGVVVVVVVNRAPRRQILFFLYDAIVVVVVALIVYEFLHRAEPRPANYNVVVLVAHLLIKSSILGALSVMELSAIEIPPTSIRSISTGIFIACKGLAGITSSFVALLLRRYDLVAEFLFLFLVLMATTLIWALPEMKDVSIPRDAKDLKQCFKNTKNKFPFMH